MAERKTLTTDWYRRNIASFGDLDFQIGPAPVIESQASVPVTVAFGTLVRLERRNKQMSVTQLADALNVEEAEVRLIEHDASYRAKPRTISKIAHEFGLPSKELMKLAGAAVSNDSRFEQEALRFAAHSDDIGSLTKEEQQILRRFVQFLRDKPKE